ncbi:hypothetical protein E4U61_002661 [Claviceps capensis]|nr:hypothetical protein E4U61_002661 [Claviceps capensis]
MKTTPRLSVNTFDDIKYPDEVLEEEACRANWTSRHCHLGGASKDAPSEYVHPVATENPDHIFKQVLRVTKIQFHRLVRWVRVDTSFEDNQHRTCGQRVMVFLYIMGFGKTQRSVARQFCMSQRSVGHIFHEVLSYMDTLYNAFVQIPGDMYLRL